MEKYRQFTDEKSGVNAFVPACMNNRDSMLVKLLRHSVMIPVVAIRVMIFCIGLVFLGLMSLGDLSAPYLNFCRYITWPVAFIGSRLILFSLGYLWIDERMSDYRRLGMRPFASSGVSLFSASAPLIFSNYTSVVDVLLLICRLNPVFVLPDAKEGCYLLSRTSMLIHSLFSFEMIDNCELPKKSFNTILDVINYQSRLGGSPVVFFPEGQRSNGLCMLSWSAPSLKTRSKVSNADFFDVPFRALVPSLMNEISVVVFEHNQTGVSVAPFTCGNSAVYLLKLMANLWNSASVYYVPKDETCLAISNLANQQSGSTVSHVFNKLGEMMVRSRVSLPWVNTTGAELANFAAYYSKRKDS